MIFVSPVNQFSLPNPVSLSEYVFAAKFCVASESVFAAESCVTNKLIFVVESYVTSESIFAVELCVTIESVFPCRILYHPTNQFSLSNPVSPNELVFVAES
jgi:hypothetical protein